jgi:chromosomal replication initiator protein
MSDVERVLRDEINSDQINALPLNSVHLDNNQDLITGQGKIVENYSNPSKVSSDNLTDIQEIEPEATKPPVTSTLTGGPLGARPLPEVWSDVIESLNHRFDKRVVSGWLKPLVLVKIDRSAQHARVVIRTPNKFVAEHVHHHYRTALTQAFSTALQLSSITIELDVSAGNAPSSQASSLEIGGIAEKIVKQNQDNSAIAQSALDSSNQKEGSQKELVQKDSQRNTYRQPIERKHGSEHNLNPRYNFSNFVIGNCNQFAHAAALQVSENLGSTYNPLFIYGGVGLGKTHLVNSIGNAAVRRGKQVLMISSESFVNELISSLRANRMQEFKQKFRSLDLLIIDDIQFMIGKERTQEEFFHTFNELHQKHKQIILTSDKLPQELIGVEERLRTRFASGLSCDLQPPDFETRVAILSKKAEVAGVFVNREIAELLSERVSSNIRELEGALTRLLALSSLRNEPLSRVLAEEAVKGYAPRTKPDITTEYIQRFVSEKYGVSISDLLGKRRTQNIAQTRQLAMYLCRRLTGCSYPEIGALFGGRDHSTVIHAFRVMEEKMQEDAVFKSDIDKLLNDFNS